MALTAQEVFTETVRTLSPNEQLCLAALILQELAHSEKVAIVNRANGWTEQDQRDLTDFSLRYAAELYPEEEELV